jgi:hypothetical protein
MRSWKTGPRSGNYYASADDCRSCRFCNKLEQRAHPHTGFIKHLFPNKVDCTGNFATPLDKDKYIIKGKGPRDYYAAVGRFMVINEKEERKFFYQFHKAYNFYLQSGPASIINIQNDELIEQKILRQQVYRQPS